MIERLHSHPPQVHQIQGVAVIAGNRAQLKPKPAGSAADGRLSVRECKVTPAVFVVTKSRSKQ